MKQTKIAFFVEGQTERIFLVKFLSEYLGGENNFSRVELKNHGSKGVSLLAERKYPNALFFVFIYDAGGDGNVVSALFDRVKNMIKEGYRFVYAIQDLYDTPRSKEQIVQDNFKRKEKQFGLKIQLTLILAIMEIEAWFLADYDLFSRINKIATPAYIKENLNIGTMIDYVEEPSDNGIIVPSK